MQFGDSWRQCTLASKEVSNLLPRPHNLEVIWCVLNKELHLTCATKLHHDRNGGMNVIWPHGTGCHMAANYKAVNSQEWRCALEMASSVCKQGNPGSLHRDLWARRTLEEIRNNTDSNTDLAQRLCNKIIRCWQWTQATAQRWSTLPLIHLVYTRQAHSALRSLLRPARGLLSAAPRDSAWVPLVSGCLSWLCWFFAGAAELGLWGAALAPSEPEPLSAVSLLLSYKPESLLLEPPSELWLLPCTGCATAYGMSCSPKPVYMWNGQTHHAALHWDSTARLHTSVKVLNRLASV